LTRITDPGLLK